MELIKEGSQGENVKKVQRLLGAVPDGKFGPNTKKKVMEWQAAHGLVADGVIGPKTWDAMFADQPKPVVYTKAVEMATYDPITKHITKLNNRSIKYLVIHYTAGASSKPGNAKACRDGFMKYESSADFAVDDTTIVQVNPDMNNYYCWAVGDGAGKYGITNRNSISIEICSNRKADTTYKMPNHEGWYFTEESLANAVKLAKYLMVRFGISLDRVVRHYDASRKSCPGIMGWNPNAVYDAVSGKLTKAKNTEEAWVAFKKRLAE